uniref:Alpha/beta fold hydrolase n=1 Tax=Phenylobacterium glaciei TaxID=2803784 RepID=A0A974S9Q8_9CAUL|nr:alpha/beta fold hydrolase [Phenylobacterium glaciei]
MAYVDEGPRDGPVALLMHGMPTWSYLNRKIIHRLVAAGWRCVAADHIGFGRSDKVTDDRWYSIARHVAAHRLLIETLDLREVTLFCQDWGGPIGLAQAAEQPERFSRLVVMNTWLHHPAYAYTDALRQWNAQWQTDGLFGINVPEKLSLGWFMMLPLGHMKPADLFGIIATGTYPTLTAEQEAIRRGYDAPFVGLDRAGHAGPRRFPSACPSTTRRAGPPRPRRAGSTPCWTGQSRSISSGGNDAVFTEDWGRAWAANYSQASFHLLPDAGHFLQDTHGEAIAEIVLEQMKAKQ